MIQRILIAVAIFVVVIFVIAFFAAGGYIEIKERKDTYTNPLAFLHDENATSPFDFTDSEEIASGTESVSLFGINLPKFPSFELEPIEPPAPFDDDIFISSLDEDRSFSSIQNELLGLESEVDELQKKLDEAQTFGTPSPFREQIMFSKFSNGTRDTNPSSEYIVIGASATNRAPINITGWSLQSALTGVRVFIPTGVPTFKMGGLGSISDVYVEPGKDVVLSSGPSPVGSSFRENICTEYMEQFQTFVPSLSSSCPSPSEELPGTLQNLQKYGASCVDFVETLDSCKYYLGSLPSDLNIECERFIKNALTYNGCVERHQWRPSFSLGDWRIFLGQPFELWQNNRDVLRLLDKEGRTVDVWSY